MAAAWVAPLLQLMPDEPQEEERQQQPEPPPPPPRLARSSLTSVAAAHSGLGGWLPLSRVGPPTVGVAPSSPAARVQPSAPSRGPSDLRMSMLYPESGLPPGPPAPPYPILPRSPRASYTSHERVPPPVKMPSWTKSNDPEAYKQEEAQYRITLSGPKLRSHRVRLSSSHTPVPSLPLAPAHPPSMLLARHARWRHRPPSLPAGCARSDTGDARR